MEFSNRDIVFSMKTTKMLLVLYINYLGFWKEDTVVDKNRFLRQIQGGINGFRMIIFLLLYNGGSVKSS